MLTTLGGKETDEENVQTLHSTAYKSPEISKTIHTITTSSTVSWPGASRRWSLGDNQDDNTLVRDCKAKAEGSEERKGTKEGCDVTHRRPAV